MHVRWYGFARGAGCTVAALSIGLLAADPAGAVAGGEAVSDGALPFLVKVSSADNACSGVLVDKRWVLTASDCIFDKGKPATAGTLAKKVTAIVGRTNLAGTAGHEISLVEAVPNLDRKVVMARLATPVTDVAPVPLSKAPIGTGDLVRIAGYGRTATDWVPDRPYSALFSVTQANDSTLSVIGKDSTSGVCKGDAGGPALRETAAGAELVGISTASWQDNCTQEHPSKRGAVESRVDTIADWVRQVAKSCQNDAANGYTCETGQLAQWTRSSSGSWTVDAPMRDCAQDPDIKVGKVAVGGMSDGTSQLLIANAGGVLFHEVRGADGTCLSHQQVAGASGGAFLAKDIAIAGLPDGSAQILAVGADNHLYHNIRFADGHWQGFASVNDWNFKRVAIAGLPDGSAQILAVGTDSVAYHNIRFADGNWQGFGTPTLLGSAEPLRASSVAIAGMPDGSAQVVAIGVDGNVYHNIRFADRTWQGYVATDGFAGASRFNGAEVAIAAMPDKAAQVVVTAPRGEIFHNIRFADRTWQGYQQLTASKVSKIAAASAPGGQLRIVAVF